MVYLIGLFVLLMIAAPIIAILPSAEQKAQMEKRKVAMAQNVRVEFMHIDDPDPDPEKYISNTGRPLERRLSVKAYRLALPRPFEWREKPVREWAFIRRSTKSELPKNGFSISGWESEVVPEEGFSEKWRDFFQQRMPRLPDDVVRVEENNFIMTIYWQERGDVKELLDFLGACKNLTSDK